MSSSRAKHLSVLSREDLPEAASGLPSRNDLLDMSSDELVALRVDLGRVVQVTNTRADRYRARIADITGELRQRERGPFEISDHALVRYLERRKGLDASAVRAEMLEEVRQASKQTKVKGKATGLVVDDLVYVVARDHLVVTVYPAHEWELD